MINPVRPATPVAKARPASAQAPAVAPAKAPKPAPVKVQIERNEWTAARILKTGASAVGGFVAGYGALGVADLLFHFGNNGGTALPGGLYLAAAGAVALGAAALYAKLSAK